MSFYNKSIYNTTSGGTAEELTNEQIDTLNNAINNNTSQLSIIQNNVNTVNNNMSSLNAIIDFFDNNDRLKLLNLTNPDDINSKKSSIINDEKFFEKPKFACILF